MPEESFGIPEPKSRENPCQPGLASRNDPIRAWKPLFTGYAALLRAAVDPIRRHAASIRHAACPIRERSIPFRAGDDAIRPGAGRKSAAADAIRDEADAIRRR